MKRLDYNDGVIRVYNDIESLCVILISNDGEVRAICYDDNFFWIGEIYYAYMVLLDNYYDKWKGDEDYKRHQAKFEKYLLKNGTTLDELQDAREYYFSFMR